MKNDGYKFVNNIIYGIGANKIDYIKTVDNVNDLSLLTSDKFNLITEIKIDNIIIRLKNGKIHSEEIYALEIGELKYYFIDDVEYSDIESGNYT